jgi:branched-chain amino acid transport system permease protein
MTAGLRVLGRSTLLRSVLLVIVVGAVLLVLTSSLSTYRQTQLASGTYYFIALAGLTVLAGLSGQISLGQGAFMAVGAYTVALLIGKEAWSVAPALAAGTAAAAVVGVPVGAAASRLRGPYLAGATLAFAVGLPSLADKFPKLLGGANGVNVNPPTPPGWLGANFSLEKWWAWIGCICALIVLFALYNLLHSGVGRAMRAVRDDEIAASLAGLRVARVQTFAFIISAACAGLAGGLLALVVQTVGTGAFQLQLSLFLLAGVVIGGLGSLAGAVWGAAILVFLPNWSSDLGHSLSLSSKVSNNLPLAIYGVFLILAMLVWPTGIQGGVRAGARRLWAAYGPSRPGPGVDEPDETPEVPVDEPRVVS